VPVTPALAGALRMLEHGIAVQPCHVEIRQSDGKKILSNLVEDWQSHGVTRDQVLRAFANSGANAYLIVCGPSGIVVADLDVKNGVDGIASWEGRPAGGVVVKTVSGGRHHYYRNDTGVGCPGSGLAGVDIKGIGGGVFGPGSLDGAYSVESWLPLTDWSSVGLELAAKRERKPLTYEPGWRPKDIFCDWSPSEAQRVLTDSLTEITDHIKTKGWNDSGFRKLLLRKTRFFGGFVGTGYLDESDAYDQLADAIRVTGHEPDDDDIEIIESGLEVGAQDPVWVATKDPAQVDDLPKDPHVRSGVTPNLSDEFWESRAVLADLRDIARTRGTSADAVLGVVLARLASLLPGTLRIDTGIGIPAACNYYSILLGTSGAGKSTAAGLAESLFPMMYDADSVAHPVGSGQGIAAAYGCVVDGEFRQNATKAFFYAEEGATLLANAKNRESIALATLREAWTGKTFGQKNATAGLNRRVSNYSLGFWMGLQSTHAAELFTETSVDDGTLARFVWFSTDDPTPLRVRHQGEVRKLKWDLGAAWGATHIVIPEWIKDELWEVRAAVLANELTLAPGQQHRGVLRVKTAVLLAIMDCRHEVDELDWANAGVVMDTSDAVASIVRQDMAKRAADAERRATAKRHRAMTADAEHSEKQDEVKIEKMVLRAISIVTDKPGISRAKLARALSTRDLGMAQTSIDRAMVRDGGISEVPSPNGRGVTLQLK
jgi:hypothetical protein